MHRLVQVASAARTKLRTRALRSVCLTTHFAGLWIRTWVASSAWYFDDLRCTPWPNAKGKWSRWMKLRNHIELVRAFMNVDAFAVLERGLVIEELRAVNSTQFPVLRDCNTTCDQNGHTASADSRDPTGASLERNGFECWRECLDSGTKLSNHFDGQDFWRRSKCGIGDWTCRGCIHSFRRCDEWDGKGFSNCPCFDTRKWS